MLVTYYLNLVVEAEGPKRRLQVERKVLGWWRRAASALGVGWGGTYYGTNLDQPRLD